MINLNRNEPTGTTPWPHQQAALEFIKNKKGAMLAMEMGTGKSYTAIEHIRDTGSKRTLIIAPLSVVDHVWADQIKKHGERKLDCVVLGREHKSTANKIKAAEIALARTRRDDAIAVIVNYETTLRKEFRNWAQNRRWDMLILDESHRVKSPSGVTAKWIAELALAVPYRLALTGTPMPHSPIDIFAQYRILDRRVFGASFHKFRDRYAVMSPVYTAPGGKVKDVIVEHKNLDELAAKFHQIAYEVRSDDVLELPPVNRLHYRVQLGDKARKLYDQLDGELRQQTIALQQNGESIHTPNALTKLLRLQQITSGFIPSDSDTPETVDDAKINAVQDIFDSIPKDEPVVVFARFLHDLKLVRDAAEKGGRKAWQLTGATKQLSEWNEEGGVLTAQIQAGGIGVDLTKARYCVYYSLGYSLGEYLQSQARLHRPGQERTVHQIHLIAAKTVDEKVMNSLEKKEDVIEAVLRSHAELED